jgi:glycosyltransferase involved in cell wall biosynthesis
VVHPDCSRGELDALYGRAAIYWHACGLHADPERNPERLEHFGISVVEAMSAGAAPLVLGAGGPAEIVAGVAPTWTDLRGLVHETERLVASPPTLERIGRAARQRAADFGPTALAARVDRLLSPVLP